MPPDIFVGIGRSTRAGAQVETSRALGGRLVRSRSTQFPLLSLFTEEIRHTVCFIGSVTRVTDRVVDMVDVTTQGEWETILTRRKLRDISRVDVGGGYERALAEVAGPPPIL